MDTGIEICRKILNTIGDETRQRFLYMLLQGECSGSPAADIAKQANGI